MDDTNLEKDSKEISDSEESTTQKLLKKDIPRLEDDSISIAPITERLSGLIHEEEKEKSSTWLYVLIGVAAVAVIAVIVVLLMGTGGDVLHSGSTDIDTSGTDSMDATIVEGRSTAVPTDASRPVTSRPDKPSKPVASSAMPKRAPITRETPIERPSPTRSEMTGGTTRETRTPPKTVETTPSSTSTTAQPSSSKTMTPKTTPPKAEPTKPKTETPSASPPSSLEQGFNLQEQKPKVKQGDLVPLTSEVIRPVLKRDVKPIKPRLAKTLRKSGKVILRILIDENGNVAEARIVNESPKKLGFGKAAAKAAKQRKYTPALKDNVRVKVWETLVFTFR